MRTKRTIEVPAKTVDETVGVSCDLCQRTIWTENDGPKMGPCHSFDEVVIARNKGHQWPEGGEKESTSFGDVCSECFESKIAPFLESIGLKRSTSECDW